MTFKNKTIQKFISSVVVIGILLPALTIFLTPKKAQAVLPVLDIPHTVISAISEVFNGTTAGSTVANTAISIKNVAIEVGKQFLMAAAKRLLAEMTKSTVTWINTGFHGQPLFLQNSQSFFTDIRKSEVRNLVDLIGYDSLRYPFGKQIALDVINSYKTQFQNNAQYSLSRVVNDPALLVQYRNNFNLGGWNGFLLNTQYPQNNYIGSQMLVQENLASRIEGTLVAPANQVKATLQQGLGFLSPQTCLSNPNYNNGINEFNRPSFVFTPPAGLVFPDDTDPKYGEEGKNSPAYIADKQKWDDAKANAEADWAVKNECPGGLVNTTPGSVAANRIMDALGSGQKQGELAAALGNNLSAIFDALINHFMQQGLNSLTSKVNGTPPQQDNWNYNGVTLGSPTQNVNGTTDVFGGPDEEIVLDKFKKQLDGETDTTNADGTTTSIAGNTGNGTYIPGDIANTEIEIKLMDNNDPVNPGIAQLIKGDPQQINNPNSANPGIIQLTQTLDQCLPGPDKGWEVRLNTEEGWQDRKLSEETASTDQLKVRAAAGAISELKFAVAAFKDWVTTKMMSSLPGAVIYMDAVKEIDNLPQQSKELTDRRRTKSQALARLQALEKSLNIIKTQPTKGSIEESSLIAIRKQYDAIQFSISNITSIEDTRSELNALKDKLVNLKDLNTQCKDARAQAGLPSLPDIQEQQVFCDTPIVSGYSHGDIIRPDDSNQHGALKFTFRNPNGNEKGNPGYEDLPMVNAREIYGDDTRKFDPVVIDINCKNLFKASPIDYTHAGDPAY